MSKRPFYPRRKSSTGNSTEFPENTFGLDATQPSGKREASPCTSPAPASFDAPASLERKTVGSSDTDIEVVELLDSSEAESDDSEEEKEADAAEYEEESAFLISRSNTIYYTKDEVNSKMFPFPSAAFASMYAWGNIPPRVGSPALL